MEKRIVQIQFDEDLYSAHNARRYIQEMRLVPIHRVQRSNGLLIYEFQNYAIYKKLKPIPMDDGIWWIVGEF